MNPNDVHLPGDLPALPAAEEAQTLVPVPGPVTTPDPPELSTAPAPLEPAAHDLADPVAEPDHGIAEVPAKPAARPLPDTLTAARDATAFVAQMFAAVGVSQEAPPPASEALVPLPVEDLLSAGEDEQALSAEQPADEVLVPPLQGQQVLILGLGASGLAMARWCVRQGASVTVADTRQTPPGLERLQAELPQVHVHAGAFEPGLVEGRDIRAVFKSPGLSPAMVAPVWQAAQAIGLWTGGELDLFARALRDLHAERAYTPKVLAITGTNGKTTTTALTGQLIAHAGKTVALAGNIGPGLLDTLAEHIDAGSLPEVWVLELSSFQLDGVQDFEPSAAVVLNLTQDHLDWHGSMQAYGAAKARVFGRQGLMVLNRDDPAVMAMRSAAGPTRSASAPTGRARLQKPKLRDCLSFGLEMPERPGDFGIETLHGMAWLVRAAEADETIKKKRPRALPPAEGTVQAPGQSGAVPSRDEDIELHVQRLMPVDALRIHGRHNATNALAALALAGTAGCSMASMLHGLREYTGEPHRVSSVAVVRDVEYFDDSKGTNVGATVAALTGLGAGRKLVLIAGGEGKGQDFSPLAEPVRRHARAVVLIGRDAPLLRAALQGSGVDLFDAASMQAAVELAARQARTGDAVLMSPACASFDMFDNYGHRAQVFCDAVEALAQDAGEPS